MTKQLADSMRLGMRRLASGVSIIATRNKSGTGFAMTVSSVTSISDEPPSLLVCVNRDTKISSELALGHMFSINVLEQSHEDVSVVCSTGTQGEERFQTGDWNKEHGPAPSLNDAEAVFFCKVDQRVSYGTHDIVIGKITEVRVSAMEPDPLIYFNGRYCQLKH